jgi:hypothetical protein
MLLGLSGLLAELKETECELLPAAAKYLDRRGSSVAKLAMLDLEMTGKANDVPGRQRR